MKNYWLKRIAEENVRNLCPVNTDYYGIEALAESYFMPLLPHDERSIRRTGDKLAVTLYILADKVLKYTRPKWITSSNRDDFIQELLAICLIKGHREYNPKKHQAFDYFTTVMLEVMRDWHRRFSRN